MNKTPFHYCDICKSAIYNDTAEEQSSIIKHGDLILCSEECRSEAIFAEHKAATKEEKRDETRREVAPDDGEQTEQTTVNADALRSLALILAEHYIREAEEQDGPEYWSKFHSATELREDFLLYLRCLEEGD